MRVADIAATTCPVARTLAVIGDAWTLLLLRELFLGQRRFEAFQAHTGMAPYLLSRRLARLAAEGIVRRVRYQTRPARYEYRLTEKGLDLYDVIVSMKRWGDRWTSRRADPAMRLVHKSCGHRMTPVLTCGECGEPVEARDVRVEMGPRMAAERRRQREEFKAGTRRGPRADETGREVLR